MPLESGKAATNSLGITMMYLRGKNNLNLPWNNKNKSEGHDSCNLLSSIKRDTEPPEEGKVATNSLGITMRGKIQPQIPEDLLDKLREDNISLLRNSSRLSEGQGSLQLQLSRGNVNHNILSGT